MPKTKEPLDIWEESLTEKHFTPRQKQTITYNNKVNLKERETQQRQWNPYLCKQSILIFWETEAETVSGKQEHVVYGKI